MSYKTIQIPEQSLLFSICTLVRDFDQYAEMRKSFLHQGFVDGMCEFLCVDNSHSNLFDAYTAINLFLRTARGRYVIICHQDILLHTDGCSELIARIAEVDALDRCWGVLGNAGALDFNDYAIRISDPHGEDTRKGAPFPAQVMSLDENFIVVRGAANLGVSDDIGGFHLYGADICLQAELRGYHSYVIDFHLRHLSAGSTGRTDDTNSNSFFQTRRRFILKYQRAFRSRWLSTTCTRMFLSGNTWVSRLGNLRKFIRYKRKIDRLMRHLKGGKRG